MTMRYTHIGIDDQAKAVAKLPTPRRRVEPAADAAPEDDPALQMRCISCGCASHAVTFDGTGDDLQKRENPCGCKGFDASGHSLATSGKVEAAGIEPASRDISTQASTCVVEDTSFARRAPRRQGSRLASRKLYFAARVSNVCRATSRDW